MKLLKRTHMCGELRKEHIGQDVVLNGWIAKNRRFGGIVFCDIRDKSGISQIVFDSTKADEQLFKLAESLRGEFVVGVRGKVVERSSKNSEIPTGDVEVICDELVLYSKADTSPIYIKDEDNVDESLRLKYRYLDLRKKKMQDNLNFRHKLMKLTRDFFDENGFTEVETPMLIKPTPEGARDYLVPSRVNKGYMYALPQSPQMFKQLLMVGGTDRYIQIVKCFRDEDLRADRQPEFTQIDMELSFVDEEDVMEINEAYLQRVFKELMGVDIQLPIRRMTYKEAMENYGSDKPDLRFGFKLRDLSHKFENSDFQVFKNAIEIGGSVRGICIDGGNATYTRKKIDKLIELSKSYGAKGLVWIKVEDEISSSVNKFFDEEALKDISNEMNAKVGDLILICADRNKVVFDTLGFLRRHIAEEMELLDDNVYELLWVVDFPLFEEDEETGKLHPMHHPFTAPKELNLKALEEDTKTLIAKAYDIVLNGVEIGGGSIRIHDREVQNAMFKAIGIEDNEIEEKFGFLVEAFKYGAPPHGGLAYGLDRLVMLLRKEKSIKEVMAFPKNQAAQCLVSEAPAIVDDEQLSELGINIVK